MRQLYYPLLKSPGFLFLLGCLSDKSQASLDISLKNIVNVVISVEQQVRDDYFIEPAAVLKKPARLFSSASCLMLVNRTSRSS